MSKVIRPLAIFKKLNPEYSSENKKGGLINIIDFILKINDYFNENNLKEYNIQVSKNFLKVQMVMAMSQGIGIMLCKERNIEMINQVIREIFHLDLIEERDEREDIKDTADELS